MEKKKKKKHKKLIATSLNQEPESHDLLSKEQQNQPNEALAAKVTKNGSSSQENLSSLNDQRSRILQWPYSTQKAAEQSSLNPRPCISSQTPPILASQPQQVAPLQSNFPHHLVQQGQPTVHLAPSTSPLWLPQRPSYHFPAVSVPATFQPLTASWQPSPLIGGTSPRSQHEVPNIGYHFSPFPSFPGPWDPSSWWTHGQQVHPSFNYTFPGAYNGSFSSEPPPMPNCSATFGESSRRGIIRPMAKLSQKHQQLWESQSFENVMLWRVIGQLQSELADYKSQILKLEGQIASLKPPADEPSAQAVQTGLSGAASKRGRPKRAVASVDVSASPDESHPQARGQKPAASKVQPESRVLFFEKVVLNKVEKTAHSISSTKKDNEKTITNNSVNGSNLPMPAFHNQAHLEGPGIQICGIETNSCLAQQPKENGKGISDTHMGGTNGEVLAWPASFVSEEPRRNIYNTISQSLYDNGCLIREAGKLIPGWSFVNEEDASDEVEDGVMASAKDENEEEMRDDVSSEAEEIAQTKDESACKMDSAVGSNPKNLPQYNNWS
ncbi:hypothetical protein E1A91_A11G229100v1 [Gossypium mustelinum]|uniref:Uncharacterized protein n=1 Tax=Gossypium mustelinum TaxID=34275 RepID=A0A5D2X9R8_GOSMU|nr:hypothetical protein E1A91_A11G229100v1 [Gossypium mustelinum]